MPQHTCAPGHVCGHCDGFPAVHITTGARNPDGTRHTITAVCPACRGTGAVAVRRALTTAGR